MLKPMERFMLIFLPNAGVFSSQYLIDTLQEEYQIPTGSQMVLQ